MLTSVHPLGTCSDQSPIPHRKLLDLGSIKALYSCDTEGSVPSAVGVLAGNLALWGNVTACSFPLLWKKPSHIYGL
jgi:hypothetical protein